MDALNNLSQQPLFWPIAGGVVAAILLGAGLWLYLRKSARSRQIKRVLKQLGNRYLKDVLIPDGLGGQIQLDYLVATHDGLMVLDVREFQGVLFGGEQLDQWAQMSQMKTYRFPNPLYGNSVRTVSVRELINEVPVFGRVVFHEGAEFPKGKPEGVSLLSELVEDLKQIERTEQVPADQVDLAWEKLREIATPSG